MNTSNKPRVAVLHYALGRFGGAAKIAILQALYLNRISFDVELFYGGPIPEDWKKRAMSELRVSPLPLGLPMSSGDIQKMVTTMKKLETFDLILISYGICPFFAFYLSLFFRRKVVWYCGEPLRALWEDYVSSASYKTQKRTVRPTSRMLYGSPYSSVFLSGTLYSLSVHAMRALDKKTARSYRKIVAQSHFTKTIVRRIYNPGDVIAVVHPGIDLKHHATAQVDISAAEGYILAAGALIPIKNYDTLLKALESVRRRHGACTTLLVIGDGPLRNEILSMIRELELQNVKLRSNVSEMELLGYYEKCRFVVHIALYEPFGLVPLEAAFFGKPSIVSNVGGPKEFVIHGQSGLLVNPFDPKEVGEAMYYLITNEEQSLQMGVKARERVLEEFNMERSSEKLATILLSVLEYL